MLALDQEAELRIDSAITLLERAISVDDEYFPAWYDYLRLAYETGGDERLRLRAARGWPGSGPTCRCVRIVAQHLEGNFPQLAPRATAELLRDNARAGACVGFFLVSAGRTNGDSAGWRAEQLRHLARVGELEPDLGIVAVLRVGLLSTAGQHAAAEALARDALRRVVHPLDGTRIAIALANARVARGDSAGARSLLSAYGAAVARDGRPGIRYEFAVRPLRRSVEELSEKIALTRARGARYREADGLHLLGHHMLDRGDPVAALRYHDRELALLERSGSPRLLLRAHVRRGRAFSKLGRWTESERDLLSAIGLRTRSNDPYFVAEAYHNLAHTYESAGRWEAAARAADEFVAQSRRIPEHGQGMTIVGLHDAGTIRSRAGWRAAARQDFARMIDEVDATGREPYWAGEHLERIGELQPALRYYHRAVASGSDVTRGLEGLVRVYDALGRADSAEVAARRHDALRTAWQPLETPLLPGILVRRGETGVAVTLARAWAAEQRASGNVHARTLATIRLAELLLADGQVADARIEADRAADLARGFRLTDELSDALRLGGMARVRLGDIPNGLRLHRAATAHAHSSGTLRARLAAHAALGDALASAGRSHAALESYERATGVVESVTHRLDSDVDRASYRARQLAPYDGAIRAALTIAVASGEPDLVLRWSARRKAASLRLALQQLPSAPPWTAIVPSTARLRRLLADGEAFLDYTVLSDRIAVVVVTNRSSRILSVAVGEDSLAKLVGRWRRRLVTSYAGRLDVARSRFDYRTAHELYRLLLAPALAASGSPRRLVVTPDGPLHYLPFEALVVTPPARDARDARYVLDDHDIAYVPSAALVSRARPRRARVELPRLFVIAGHAPAAGDEARAIARVWSPGRVRIAVGRAATETAIRRAAGVDILHLAVHARADAEDALASHLKLRADATNDGFLHLSEIAGSPALAEVVVLSACETFSGPLFRGEGVSGLARAFLTTGTRSVIATQWPVGEPNVELMRSFYRELARGADIRSALAKAKREMRNRVSTAHPLFWAGTILVGT